MADWVTSFKPYQSVDKSEIRMGTVLRRVPFPVSALGSTAFGLKTEGSTNKVGLGDIEIESEVVRSDKVVISPGVIITPDCDIYQQKCNRVVVAQLVGVETHISNQSLTAPKSKALKEEIEKARASNPGALNRAGLFLLLADASLGFGDHFVLMENQISLPVEFTVVQGSGLGVTEVSVGGKENLWFQIKNDLLRGRLTTEISRHFLRIGLPDAT